MSNDQFSDERIAALLRAHPTLRDRFASIVKAVENSDGELNLADDAEERLVEEMRHLGREAMEAWAQKRVETTEKEVRAQPRMHRQGEKKSTGIRNLAGSRS
jgi:hypothetical protein